MPTFCQTNLFIRRKDYSEAGFRQVKGYITQACTAKTKYRNFETNIPRKGISGSHSQISTFMPQWVFYIFPRSVCLFCWRKYVDQSWAYINRSQTLECGNWGWGRAIPRKGIPTVSGIFVAVWSGSMEKEIVLKYTDRSTNIATHFPNNYSHPSPSNLATHFPPT